MKNRIILLLVCLIIFSSCGKKGDPEYQGNNLKKISKNS